MLLIGVALDSHLNFYNHISYIWSSYFHIHCLRYIRPILGIESFKTIVGSRLDFSICTGISSHNIYSLQHVQKSQTRHNSFNIKIYIFSWIICFQYGSISITNWLLFSTVNSTMPALGVSSAIILHHEIVDLQNLSFHQPQINIILAPRCFHYAGQSFWNVLPPNRWSISSYYVFKSNLKFPLLFSAASITGH